MKRITNCSPLSILIRDFADHCDAIERFRERRQEAGDARQLEEILVAIAVGTALDDPNLVVESVRKLPSLTDTI